MSRLAHHRGRAAAPLGAPGTTGFGLRLAPITLAYVLRGGYKVSYSFSARPSGSYRVFLGPATAESGKTLAQELCVDITASSPRNAVTLKVLPKLLDVISTLDKWNGELNVRVFVVLNGEVVARSEETRVLKCPVTPIRGSLLPLESNDPPLRYLFKAAKSGTGDDQKESHGRWLHNIPGRDELYFTEAGRFETDPTCRGFGCIGYASLVWGMPFEELKYADVLRDGYGGEDLANYVGATVSTSGGHALQNVDPQVVLDFFKGKPAGYYLLWSGTHIMIVTDGYVYEFNQVDLKKDGVNIDGYGATPIETRLRYYVRHAKKLTVCRLPGKPARAR